MPGNLIDLLMVLTICFSFLQKETNIQLVLVNSKWSALGHGARLITVKLAMFPPFFPKKEAYDNNCFKNISLKLSEVKFNTKTF